MTGRKTTKVKVNQRALVQKVLARYPEEFTVFRKLVQNADDAGATNVEIEFQTKGYAAQPSGNKATNGTHIDLSSLKVSKWVVRNDGNVFKTEDWDRLANIADGNPDDQKIGTFGVGFFSVFGVTECPVVISGCNHKKMYYEEDQLVVSSVPCKNSAWTIIEMEVKDEQLHLPKPFDLSRFLCTAVTFLTKVNKITVCVNGQLLSEITKSRCAGLEIKELPKDLKRKRDSGFMQVESVKTISQKVQVTLTKLAYSAGSKRSRVSKAVVEKECTNPAQRPGFFGSFMKKAELNRARAISGTTTVSVEYTIYSANICSAPAEDIVSGLLAATKKNPLCNFLYEAVHLSMDQHQRVMKDGSEEGSIGSVFRGVQALCNEEGEGHGSRLFIGQSTAQTSGIAAHLSSRFIPTVERGLIDLANGQVAKWNEELLYVGGFLARLIYERSMADIQSRWLKSPPSEKDPLREEALYIMRCFTFRQSTTDLKVGELLKGAFFNCSTTRSLPILSNLGIRNSQDVRQHHSDFESFMKERPILDGALQAAKSVMLEQLPKEYQVTLYTFRDVKEELECRTFTEKEMIACIGWWVRTFWTAKKQTSGTNPGLPVHAQELLSVARFRSSSTTSPQDISFSTIKKFVDTRPGYSFIQDDDPLPANTISPSFTKSLNADHVIQAFGWEQLTIVDWIRHLVSPGVDPCQDICKDTAFSERVLTMLNTSWPSINATDRETIIALMRDVNCIPTNKGHCQPQEAYFPEVDLFDELPVVQSSLSLQLGIVLYALGVQPYVQWDQVEHRLQSTEYSMMRLAAYLQAVSPQMGDKFETVKDLPIFVSEEGTRHCIRNLYSPHPIHHTLGLPVLRWNNDPACGPFVLQMLDVGYEYLCELGLQQHPPLDLIIEKASSKDATVRQNAYDFFVSHLEDHYRRYDPAQFPNSAFLPCGKGDEPPQFGTPEEVFTSPEWEIFGFRTIHETVPARIQTRLKVKDRPSGAAMVKAMQAKSLPSKDTVLKWFELAGRGGLSAEDLATLSDAKIVPVTHIPLATSPDGTNPESADLLTVAPNKCFYGRPDPAKGHHRALFTYVDYGQKANEFLKTCGAKPNPSCLDIIQTMIENPQGYLDMIETHLVKVKVDKTQACKKYLDDLRQVAAGYHGLATDLRDRMKTAPIFISFRKKPRVPGSSPSAESREYVLKRAHDVLIADDTESHRLFGEHIFVAPKEEVFENFYRDHGSKFLSAHVNHEVNYRGFVDKHDEANRLRCRVLERLKIFLHDQDSTRRKDFHASQWQEECAFTVKYSKTLEISKSLNFEHTRPATSQLLVPKCEQALAGIIHTEGNDTLWVKRQPEKHFKNIWYDVAVALCRIIFTTHKTHDTLLLMTILEADLNDLRHRGYDVDAIWENFNQQAERAVQSQPTPEPDQRLYEANGHSAQPLLPSFSSFPDLPFSLNYFKKKDQPNNVNFDQGAMEEMVSRALDMCKSDADMCQERNRDKSKGGKKRRDVKYCDSRTDLMRCTNPMKKGMPVFKTHGSGEPPESALERFSSILQELGKLFGLGPENLHIFWQPDDIELMGFNRNKAIYLNLAHYSKKHAELPPNDDSQTITYTAWYFIIAHEIAHNMAFFHDEDHELLFSSLAQSRLVAFRKFMEKKAPNAVATIGGRQRRAD
ncbi:hypothetical protein BS17DRAFT_791170 [Gyrodon lividus]|nr:hypothetical protein BS17DRAFT_791170 [Gyrodon lividus]